MLKKITFEQAMLALLLVASAAVLIMSICGVIGSSPAAGASIAFAAVVIPGASGGRHVADGPLTTTLTNSVSPDLLRNEIDERVTKIRPCATPIDQISRCAGTRLSGSMIVDYYSVDTKPSEAKLAVSVNPSGGTQQGSTMVYKISTTNDLLFDPTETILVPDYQGYDSNGSASGQLVLYVVSRASGGGLNVIAVNGRPDNDEPAMRLMPALIRDARLVRMGRAAAELDVQTPQFNALPKKSTNFCQIFKAQVEQSTYQKIANKEVGWTFSDQEETAIIDMRQCLERSFLFGSKARIFDPEKGEEIMLTGGIWNQAGSEYRYNEETTGDDFIINLTRRAFTGNGGSTRKILIAGTDLIEFISRQEATRVLMSSDSVTHWGIDFKELHSKFGTLYIIHSEIFDSCGMSGNGIVIDPEYITKYSHVPFQTEHLDLKSSGQRNTDAVVITEASCLVLRYPSAHCRVVYEEAD